LGERWRRPGERVAAGRADGFAVEAYDMPRLIRLIPLAAFACGNCHRLVETTPQRRPHRVPRRLDRTIGLMAF